MTETAFTMDHLYPEITLLFHHVRFYEGDPVPFPNKEPL